METKSKAKIRKEVLTVRDALTKEERILKSRQIVEQLVQMEEYQRAEKVLCYISFRSEVMTGLIAQHCHEDGKRFFAPRVEGKAMQFYQVRPYEEMERNSMGILEPIASSESLYTCEQKNDLMILPAVAIDEEKNRIGYGGGYYDRFLAKGFRGKTVALAYECQIIKSGSSETEITDVRPEKVLTEERVF